MNYTYFLLCIFDYIKKVGRALVFETKQALYLQLIFGIIWLPISAYWGMGWPILAMLGNIIFGHVASFFLWIASLLFFANYLPFKIPWLASLLDIVCKAWCATLSYAPPTLIYNYPKPSLWLCIATCIALIFIMHNRNLHTPKKRLWALVLLFGFVWLSLYSKKFKSGEICTPVKFGRSSVVVLYTNNRMSLLDQGALGSSVGAPNQVEYGLLPELYKKWGINCLEHVIMLKINATSLESLKKLCSLIAIKNIYIPYWKGEDKKMSRAYARLAQEINNNGIQLHRIGYKKLTINLSAQYSSSIEPQEKWVTKGCHKFPKFIFAIESYRR